MQVMRIYHVFTTSQSFTLLLYILKTDRFDALNALKSFRHVNVREETNALTDFKY